MTPRSSADSRPLGPRVVPPDRDLTSGEQSLLEAIPETIAVVDRAGLVKLRSVVGIDDIAAAICRAIHARRMVAEGIETDAELATLRDLGVPFGQGYLLGRPARTDAADG